MPSFSSLPLTSYLNVSRPSYCTSRRGLKLHVALTNFQPSTSFSSSTMAKKIRAPAATSAKPNAQIDLLDLDCVSEPQYVAGSTREYLVTSVPQEITTKRTVSSKEIVFVAILVAASVAVRLAHLEHPNSVVFDEVHFGGFAKKYVLGNFFMDVHPPLAKMLFAAVSLLGGFKGDFDFAHIGDIYPDSVPYYWMRAFPAVLGVATVVLCYLTLRASGVRPAVALITSACLLFENSYVTISRYILLDAPLLFFIAAAVYSFKKFEVQQPFSINWYRLLLSCSIALGLAFSSKWVGLFTIAWAGVLCAIHMWFLIGDLSVKPATVWKHAITRASFLLGVPTALYLLMFSIHFNILTNDGDGSAFMTSAFRSGLRGSLVPRSTTAQVGYGSVVTIRHVNTRGGYLHSHNHFYPAGSKQQQITLYPHLDAHNDWLIEPYNFTIPEDFTQLKDGVKIRLKHVVTHRRLHSHDEKPPVSERDWQKETSCYGYEGFGGDANDDWIVEVVKHETPKEYQENITAIHTIFRLRHAMSGNYLFSSEVKLPLWGFEQQEVSAASSGYRPLTYWYIETNTNERLPESEKKTAGYPKMSFLAKFLESHKTMWKINQGLTGHHNWQSDPQDWPLLIRGINYWGKDHTQVYLLGNPIVWWTASSCLVAFIIHVAISVLKWQTGKAVATNKNVFNFNTQMLSYFAGWAIHYVPFFIMGRQLFLHHYLPSQYFAILGLGHVFELVVASSTKYSRPAYGALVLFFVGTLIFYNMLAPLISAQEWTQDECEASKKVSSWDYDCKTFFKNKLEYRHYTPTTSVATSTSASKSVVETPRAPEQQQAKIVESPQKVVEEPPKPETHVGQLPEHLRGDDEAPHAEQEDVATPQKDEEVPAPVDTIEDAEKVGKNEAAPAEEPVVEAETVEVDPAAESAKEVVEPVVEAASGAAETVAEAAHEAAEPIVDAAQEAAEPIVEAAQEAAEPIVEAAQEVAEPVVESVKVLGA